MQFCTLHGLPAANGGFGLQSFCALTPLPLARCRLQRANDAAAAGGSGAAVQPGGAHPRAGPRQGRLPRVHQVHRPCADHGRGKGGACSAVTLFMLDGHFCCLKRLAPRCRRVTILHHKSQQGVGSCTSPKARYLQASKSQSHENGRQPPTLQKL